MFDQFYSQFKNLTDFNAPQVLNFERKIYFSNFIEEQSDLEDDLHFCLEPFYKIIKTTNRENYPKVVINVLNCLSFWFDFCIFDLQLYWQKLFGLFPKIYAFLLSLRSKLNSFLVY